VPFIRNANVKDVALVDGEDDGQFVGLAEGNGIGAELGRIEGERVGSRAFERNKSTLLHNWYMSHPPSSKA
jgi:hypothetical protein